MTDAIDTAAIPFDELANLFAEQGALVSPSEVHGYLVGFLAAGQRHTRERWLRSAAEQLGVDALTVTGLAERLESLHRQTLAQLETHGFELELLLPDDEQAISERADALGVWCHGFVTGYTLAGGSQGDGLSADARDALEDFTQIARIAVDPDDQESEPDLAEVYEYVRMAALLLFSECNRSAAEQCAPPGAALH